MFSERERHTRGAVSAAWAAGPLVVCGECKTLWVAIEYATT